MTRDELISALLVERFGPPPYRTREDPPVLARRRRQLANALREADRRERQGKGAA